MSTTDRLFIILGCLFLTAAGALSAYGFHGIDWTAMPDKQASWAWAVEMQFYHGLGLILVGIIGARVGSSWPIRIAGTLMTAGILIFSGLIYAETLGAPEAVGEIVPSGGSCMMLSWLALAVGILRARN